MLSLLNLQPVTLTDSVSENGVLPLSNPSSEGRPPFSNILLGEKNSLIVPEKLQELAAGVMAVNQTEEGDLNELELDQLMPELTVLAQSAEESLLDLSAQESSLENSPPLLAFLMSRAGVQSNAVQLESKSNHNLMIAPSNLNEILDSEVATEQADKTAEPVEALLEEPSLLELLALSPQNVSELKQRFDALPSDHPVKAWLIEQQVITVEESEQPVSDDTLNAIVLAIAQEYRQPTPDSELVEWVEQALAPIIGISGAEFAKRVENVLPHIAMADQIPKVNQQQRAEVALPQQLASVDAVDSSEEADSPFTPKSNDIKDVPIDQPVRSVKVEMAQQSESAMQIRNAVTNQPEADDLHQLRDIRLESFSRPQAVSQPAGTNAMVSLADQMTQQLARSPEFTSALNERIMTMVNGELKRAIIRMDPPELGALEVRVQVNQDQTNIQIVSNNPQVREALESQSVRLREALAEQGMNLAQLDISHQGSQSGQQQGDGQGGRAGHDTMGDFESQNTDTETRVVMSNSLVDHYV